MWPHRRLEVDPETHRPLHMWASAVVSRTGKVIQQQYDANGPDQYKIYGERYVSDVDVDSPGHALVVTGFVSGDIGFWMKGAPERGRLGLAAAQRWRALLLLDSVEPSD